MQLQAIITLILVNGAWSNSIHQETDKNDYNSTELLDFLRDIKQDLHNMQQRSQEHSENLFQVSKKLSTIEKRFFGIVERERGLEQHAITPVLGPFEIPSRENCWIRVNSICYWAEVHVNEDITGARASTICRDRNSEIGQIPDYYTYEQVTRYLKTLIPRDQKRISVLFDLRVDQNSHEVFPPNNYARWRPSRPKSGYSYREATYVYLLVSNDPKDSDVGMSNGDYGWDYKGVLCQVPLPKHLYPHPTLKLEQLDAFYGTANCDVRINSTCYWAEIHVSDVVHYKKAEQICNERDSVVAQIPDRYTYEHVMSYLRTQVPTTQASSWVWFDLRVKPTTAEVFPTNGYTRWAADSPKTKYPYGDATYTSLYVPIFINSEGQGMKNHHYTTRLNGVLCQQKPPEDRTVNTPPKIVEQTCEGILIYGTCYWAKVYDDNAVNLLQATHICSLENATFGHIPDKHAYDMIMDYLRTKIYDAQTATSVWIDLTVEPRTGEVEPRNSYKRWAKGFPSTRFPYDSYDLVYLLVEIFLEDPRQGMKQAGSTTSLRGVLCQKIL